MDIKQTITEGEALLQTMPFGEFCNKINDSFNALIMLSELYKSGNPDLINILNEVENGG